MKLLLIIRNILILQCPCKTWLNTGDDCSDTSGSLWQFKTDEIEKDVDLNLDVDHIPNSSSSFKYKPSFITNRNGVKIAVPLKYLINFWRSLETPLVSCKVDLSLKWNENWVLSSEDGNSIFAITDLKLYVPTLSAEDNVNCQNYEAKDLKDLFIGINIK